jgi:hypothetical protein
LLQAVKKLAHALVVVFREFTSRQLLHALPHCVMKLVLLTRESTQDTHGIHHELLLGVVLSRGNLLFNELTEVGRQRWNDHGTGSSIRISTYR